MRAYSSLFMPNATAEEVRWLANLQRNATSADVAVRLRAAYDDIDVSDLLGRVRAPTLVFHSRRDAVAPFEEGKRVAASIPGAKFVPLDSDNHIILANEPAWPQFLHQLESFLGEADR
jgi:pimeloyl-ACP methyl ester carboxylesterase